MTWMIGSVVQIGTCSRPPQLGASHAGPLCATPQIDVCPPRGACAPISVVSKGVAGLRRRSSSDVNERGALFEAAYDAGVDGDDYVSVSPFVVSTAQAADMRARERRLFAEIARDGVPL